MRHHYRRYRLLQLGLAPADIDNTPAVDLDWLLAIDATVAKAQNDSI